MFIGRYYWLASCALCGATYSPRSIPSRFFVLTQEEQEDGEEGLALQAVDYDTQNTSALRTVRSIQLLMDAYGPCLCTDWSDPALRLNLYLPFMPAAEQTVLNLEYGLQSGQDASLGDFEKAASTLGVDFEGWNNILIRALALLRIPAIRAFVLWTTPCGTPFDNGAVLSCRHIDAVVRDALKNGITRELHEIISSCHPDITVLSRVFTKGTLIVHPGSKFNGLPIDMVDVTELFSSCSPGMLTIFSKTKYKTVADLYYASDSELLAIPKFGKSRLEDLRRLLNNHVLDGQYYGDLACQIEMYKQSVTDIRFSVVMDGVSLTDTVSEVFKFITQPGYRFGASCGPCILTERIFSGPLLSWLVAHGYWYLIEVKDNCVDICAQMRAEGYERLCAEMEIIFKPELPTSPAVMFALDEEDAAAVDLFTECQEDGLVYESRFSDLEEFTALEDAMREYEVYRNELNL